MAKSTNILLSMMVAIVAILIANLFVGEGNMVNDFLTEVIKRGMRTIIPADLTKKYQQDTGDVSYDLQIIGSGFGRTGTTSTKVALEQLNFGPVHHMGEVFARGASEHKKWENIGKEKDEKKRKALLKDALRSFKSNLDFPSCQYWKELSEMYPNAKVLLTVRDSPEQWIASAYNSIFAPAEFDQAKSVGDFLTRGPILGPGLWLFMNVNPLGRVFRGHFASGYWKLYRKDPKEFAKVYSDWVAEVKRTIPSDRLLVFNVKEGWDPLVKFLGVERPSTPFPKVNEGENTEFFMLMLALLGWGTIIVPVLIVMGIIWKLRRK
jgi:hypothetical protein